jgi:LysR family glycine cleavage system transcriptional activator
MDAEEASTLNFTSTNNSSLSPVVGASRIAALPSRGTPSLAALHAFERSATHLSFRRAASDLSLTASAISHQIRKLEEYLGVRLFVRDARPLALTAEGVRYLASVSSGLAILGEASRELLRQGRGASADLRVSATPFFNQTMILPHLAEFRTRRASINIHVHASQDYADVAGGQVDVAIRLGRERATGLRLEPLLEVFRMPVASRAIAETLTRPEDLAGQTLIHTSGLPDAWPMWMRAAGVDVESPAGEIWVESGAAAIEAAEHGLGIALPLFPLAQLRPGFGETIVAPFDIESSRGAFFFVTRPEHSHDRQVDAFRRFMFEMVQRLFGGGLTAAAA